MTAQGRRPLTARLRCGGAVVVTGVLVAGLAGCTSGETTPPPTAAEADEVALTADVPDSLSVGVVVTLASEPGNGAEWRDAAEGARVAARRFAMGGTEVALVAVDDQGTTGGAAAAVRTLVDGGVAGIVLASGGDHLRGAVDEATAQGVPVLLPYADEGADLPPGSWLTGPEATVAEARLVQVLRDRGVTQPFLVDAGGGPPEGLTPSGRSRFRPGGDAAEVTTALQRRQERDDTAVDAVVVSGPAELQATVVQELQGAGVDLPFFLTTQALSPVFPAALQRAEGSLEDEFVSAGLDTGDAAALEPSARGRALAAYFAALRLTATDTALRDLLGERPFAEVAGAADVRSHDAVVALVRAAAAAGSKGPAEVAEALPGLRLAADDGLAGPALDFATPVAVAADAVVALGATSSSPGVRPMGAGSPTLFWFPAPQT